MQVKLSMSIVYCKQFMHAWLHIVANQHVLLHACVANKIYMIVIVLSMRFVCTK